jgi:hypothetical protein
MFDVCTTGDTAHIDTIFKFLPHTRHHGCIDILHCWKTKTFLQLEMFDVYTTDDMVHIDTIIEAVKNIDAPMLTRVWEELEYRIDVCRVTHGAYMEHV